MSHAVQALDWHTRAGLEAKVQARMPLPLPSSLQVCLVGAPAAAQPSLQAAGNPCAPAHNALTAKLTSSLLTFSEKISPPSTATLKVLC